MRSRRRSSRCLAALGPAVLAAGCAHLAPPAGPPPPAAIALPVSAYGARQLFRLSYEDEGGGASGRLALLLPDAERYQLRAVDPFGRALWSLEVDAAGALLLDHRRRTFCRSGGSPRLPELDVGVLPLAAVPAILLGYLPVAPPPAASGPALAWTDEQGRRWSARTAGGLVTSWILWRDERPLVWWTRQPDGGILSHRNGEQYRWRATVREPLVGDLPGLAPPAGYRETTCDERDLSQLREDQPASAGGGAAGRRLSRAADRLPERRPR